MGSSDSYSPGVHALLAQLSSQAQAAYTNDCFAGSMPEYWMFRSETVVASAILIWFTAAAGYAFLVSR